MLTGKIIKQISNLYTVEAQNKIYSCSLRGKFRKAKVSPFVGDEVVFDEENRIIEQLLPRKNELNRPEVANFDCVLIVTSVKKPDLSLALLDKQIIHVTLANAEPVLYFTKLDLCTPKELEEIAKIIHYYQTIGYKVYTKKTLKELKKALQSKIVILTGQSGAGKSTLLNTLEPNLNLKTDEISTSLNRGKHTTRHRELYALDGIWFCDTPGFSSLNITNITVEDLQACFVEFKNDLCRFKDCKHINEKDCQVKEDVEKKAILKSRYQNYCQFMEERKEQWK